MVTVIKPTCGMSRKRTVNEQASSRIKYGLIELGLYVKLRELRIRPMEIIYHLVLRREVALGALFGLTKRPCRKN